MLFLTGSLTKESIRQLTTTGSLSGAVIGGVLFGAGMVLARGCASRLLVLSGTGNLRALVTGLVLTIVAQATLTGVLSPLREYLARLWTVDASARDLGLLLPEGTGAVLGFLLLGGALVLGTRHALGRSDRLAALLTGSAIVLGWALTARVAEWSFEPVYVQSISFTGPSANTLMALITETTIPFAFATGLVPGVFSGAAMAALQSGRFRIQTFDAETGMTRYMVGAVLMGFGGMLAGGCAVGAGVTGGAVLALTAWTALFFMWLGAGLTDLLVDRPPARHPMIDTARRSL